MSRRSRPPSDTVVAYLRVSTGEQAESGAGLAAQRSAIEHEVERRGWRLVETYVEPAASGKSLKGRPQLAAALEAVESGAAAGLVVAKLDRLSRSLLDFAALMERAQRHGWNLIALDLGIDLSTPAGEFLASVMASAAQWERRIISQRTKDALAAKRAQGVRLGRKSSVSHETMLRIAREREDGRTIAAIAEGLTADGILTPGGKSDWQTSTIRGVLKSQDLQQLLAADAESTA